MSRGTLGELMRYWTNRARMSKGASGELYGLYKRYRLGAYSFGSWLWLLQGIYARQFQPIQGLS